MLLLADLPLQYSQIAWNSYPSPCISSNKTYEFECVCVCERERERERERVFNYILEQGNQ